MDCKQAVQAKMGFKVIMRGFFNKNYYLIIRGGEHEGSKNNG